MWVEGEQELERIRWLGRELRADTTGHGRSLPRVDTRQNPPELPGKMATRLVAKVKQETGGASTSCLDCQ